jgi:hypothetical protein
VLGLAERLAVGLTKFFLSSSFSVEVLSGLSLIFGTFWINDVSTSSDSESVSSSLLCDLVLAFNFAAGFLIMTFLTAAGLP